MSRLTHKTDGKYYPSMSNIVRQENYDAPNYRALIHEKLGKLEDLEEELGCPLEVVIEALIEGITFEHRGFNLRSNDIHLFYFNNKWIMRVYAFIQGYGSNVYDLELKDYGKIWWLKGEK